MHAGYNWQLGWYLECAWQVAFVQQSQAGMLIALVFIVSALGAFIGERGPPHLGLRSIPRPRCIPRPRRRRESHAHSCHPDALP